MLPAGAGRDRGWRGWLPPCLMLLALLLLIRPFRGVFHDGYLYAAQTLARLGTPGFAEDLFFRFGNQDSFSVFTTLFAPFVRVLGLNHATMLFWGMGLALWAAAVFTISVQLFSGRHSRILALLGVLILAPGYGDTSLYYGENFVTPRVFSEALGMFAIAAALRRRVVFTVLLTLLALMLHPLMGLAVAALSFWLFYPSLRIFAGLVTSGLLLGIGLALLGLSPFLWLLETMDDQWLEMVSHRSIALASSFGISGLLSPVLPTVSLVLVAVRDKGTRARLARGVLLVSAVMVAISLIGADLLGNRLIVGLQLWRALFLNALFGNLFAIFALTLMPGYGRARVLLLIAIILNAVEHVANIQQLGSSVVAMAALATGLQELRQGRPAGLLLRVTGLLVAALATISVAGLSLTYAMRQMAEDGSTLLPLRIALAGLLAAALLLWPVLKWRRLGLLAMVAGIIGALWNIDHRTGWQRYIEADPDLPPEVAEMVRGRVVYWEGGLDMMWVKLHQPQFFSCRQQAGIAFFRAQADELRRRSDVLSTLNTSDFADGPEESCPPKHNPMTDGPDSPEQLRHVCKALPELEVMVLLSDVGGLSDLRWAADPGAKGPFGPASDVEAGPIFHFYDCAGLRDGLR